ncbi:acyltransferase [Aeromonas cavernicola]|uniref:Acetyltransferase n=1 Tax=Aeromonas cavernicola TaxID=1006623 RepID=A0A2H9U808_9GAMM|nr:acyltransferase [Aeromonas cavernicola]PJG60144.1 acetyltransferase [Aeromonas cavernicola]
MSLLNMHNIKAWAKQGDTPMARQLWRFAKRARGWSCPVIPPLHRLLYRFYLLTSHSLATLTRTLWWTPLFQSRLTTPAPRLYLYGGIPFISGPVTIEIGADCRLSAAITISGRPSSEAPLLKLGSNIDIGWQTTLAIGRKIILGDNVRIAGRAFLAGYPGHPLDAKDRALGKPDLDEQVGDIVLEQDVWLGTGVMVMAGVTIGAGTVVAAGSIVTRSLPAGVLAAGIPAQVIRTLGRQEQREPLISPLLQETTS